MSTSQTSPGMFAGAGIMLLSAAVFGYFGFVMGMTATTSSGEFVLFFAILLWTLRIGAIGFALAGILTLLAPFAGNLLYAVTSMLTAMGFVTVGIMDLLDDQRAAALPPVLAFIFAAWNGFGSWSSLREMMASRDTATPPAM